MFGQSVFGGFGERKRAVRTVLQNETMECGLACLAMVANAHRHDIDLPYLRALFPPSQEGMTFAEIVEVAGQIGLDAQGLAISNTGELSKLACPAILHWNGNHFVVLEKVVRGTFHVHDPAFGERLYAREDMEHHFGGIALEFERRVDFEAVKTSRKSLFWAVLRSCRGIEHTLALITVLSFSATLFALATPIFLQTAVDSVIPQYDLDLLTVVVIGLILFSALDALSRWLRDLVALRSATLFEIHFTRNIVSHAFRLPMTFFEARHPGDFVTRVSSVDQIKTFLVGGFVSSIADGTMSILLVGMMYYYSPAMAFASVVTLAAAILVRFATYPGIARSTALTLESRSEEQARLLDGLAQIRALKVGNTTNFFGLKWLENFTRFANYGYRAKKLSIDADLFLHLIFMLGTVATLFMGVTEVMKSTLSVGVLYAFFALRASFFTAMNTLIMSLLQISVMRVHFARLDDVLNESPEPASAGLRIDRLIRRSVSLEEVSIQFGRRGRPLIEPFDLTIRIDKPETIAIVGPSGCGKSSLLKVLSSLNVRATGRMMVDGSPLEEFGIHEYRANIGCVFADDRVLAGTVIENLSLFSPDVTHKQMKAALSVVGLLEEIQSLPQGFATLLSDESPLLSTGQRRRLILARALCRQPRLLLLDEVTANLDPVSEEALIRALMAIPVSKVFVTHSAHLLPFADRILQVKDGRLQQIDGLKRAA
ncbi:peptidase domain-containing ABC transporter [Methylobacterium sp. Leaf112]|uniref:peptidase domain-containing ABC transporter n=1 Tax=Methylobacterium sp. Leaf112 TaxID=1736258 RepID=UPI0006FDAA03|nr:peptidase domain-containing ABC transporter [Methylobacterium sp. Leaf112]KQP59302.1 ABC transporter [Methylobacterium sp. Leaf112]USU32638.1 peptidase domain-containing ABC transporter [Methylobacterium sp. OTU13CASTA1]